MRAIAETLNLTCETLSSILNVKFLHYQKKKKREILVTK